MASDYKIPDATHSPYFAAGIWPIIWDVKGIEYQVTPHVHKEPPRDQTGTGVEEYGIQEHYDIDERLFCSGMRSWWVRPVH